jgi:hypothetical protein
MNRWLLVIAAHWTTTRGPNRESPGDPPGVSDENTSQLQVGLALHHIRHSQQAATVHRFVELLRLRQSPVGAIIYELRASC